VEITIQFEFTVGDTPQRNYLAEVALSAADCLESGFSNCNIHGWFDGLENQQ
jgi:hypothetical protein